MARRAVAVWWSAPTASPRACATSPPRLTESEFSFGHANPCGIAACAPDSVYMWMLTPHVERGRFLSEDELFDELKRLLADFGGNSGWIRDNMTRERLDQLSPASCGVAAGPMADGGTVLLGDAVHATTPHLACGAGMAVESGIVVVGELARAETGEAGLRASQQRRYPRCKDVIDASVAVGRLQLVHGDPREHAAILEGALSWLNADF